MLYFIRPCLTGIMVLVLTFILLAPQAFAQGMSFRRLYNDELALLTDNHTFWKVHKLDRMYFAPDGTFIQQLNDGWNNIEPGTMFTGTWKIENDQICWNYDAKTADVYQTSSDPYCYQVMTNSPADNFMVTHMETFRLYPVIENSQAQRIPAFEWDRYAYDNYVLEPEFVPTIQQALQTMASYRRAGYIPGGTIIRDELTSERMQQYYDIAINKVFFIAQEQMFFNDKGLYFFTDEGKIAEANGNVDEMIATGIMGRWQMKDNIHCWYLSENRSSCEYVVPEGRGLIRPYEGFLGFHHSSFSRVHGEMAVGHLAPGETSAPALFNRLLTVTP